MVPSTVAGPRGPQTREKNGPFFSKKKKKKKKKEQFFANFFFCVPFRSYEAHVKLPKLFQNFSLRFWKFTFFFEKKPKDVFPKNVSKSGFYIIDSFFPNRSSAPRENSISQPFLNFEIFPMGRNAIPTPDSGRPSNFDGFFGIASHTLIFRLFLPLFGSKNFFHPKYGLWGLKSKEIARAFTSRDKIQGFLLETPFC